MDKREIGEINKLNALTLIWEHGWIRSQELGIFMWPKSNSYKKNAEALARKLIDQNLVIPRKLPLNSGTALVLSKKGADALIERDIDAVSQKSFGEMNKGVWTAPGNWKHDLLCTGALAYLKKRGFNVISEKEIKRKYPNLKKYPDGVFLNDENAYWLEVENQRKSGKLLNFMVDTLINLRLNGIELFGKKFNIPVVAYAKNSIDEKKNKIDHKTRVTNASMKSANFDFNLHFIKLETYGFGVSDISTESIQIKSNLITSTMNKVTFHETEPNRFIGVLDGYDMLVYKLPDGVDGYGWALGQNPHKLTNGSKVTYDDAARACVRAYLKHKGFH